MANIGDAAGFILSHKITQPFGAPEPLSPTGTHTGIDFAMDRGTPVPTLHGGRVRVAGMSSDGLLGNVVIGATGDGDEGWHAPLDPVATPTGAVVNAGEVNVLAGAN